MNGGPSGVGVANTAGKALFWDFVGAPLNNAKIIAFEGEFAFTEGHAQELKTVALAQQVGVIFIHPLNDWFFNCVPTLQTAN